MKKVILLALLPLVCAVPSFAQQQDDFERYRREQRESLRGLDAVTIFVSAPAEFNPFEEEAAVRARLEKAGVKLNTEGPATLLVSIYARRDARLA